MRKTISNLACGKKKNLEIKTKAKCNKVIGIPAYCEVAVSTDCKK